MFRRRRKGDSAQGGPDDESLDEARDDAGGGDAAADDGTATTETAAGTAETAAGQPGSGPFAGPYDVDSAPDDDLPRVDLGSLRVPLLEGLEVRLDVDQETGQPAQLVLADGENLLQVGAFAAPRSSGIWAEVRTEIAEALAAAGGSAAEEDGPLGIELKASIPTGQPGQYNPARFIGVDRPRWFLRGLLSGPAALDRDAAARLESVFRGTIVVRGQDAMPIRDPLPLKLPTEGPQTAGQEGDEAPSLDQLDPGPTITETR